VRARGALLVSPLTTAFVAARRWFARCERACAAADRDAHDLFQRGELRSALAVIDAVDAKCRCSRFTAGDAPPQYALAQACLRELLEEGRGAEAEDILAQARGPILRGLGWDGGGFVPPMAER
jgi:hypothetical protein